MIDFINNNESEPYKKFRQKYDLALNANQNAIEAASIASFNKN